MSKSLTGMSRHKRFPEHLNNWVILLNLVHTGNIQVLAILYNLAANEQGFLPKTGKILINTPK